MSAGFARHQLKKLATGLDPARIQTREQDGQEPLLCRGLVRAAGGQPDLWL